MAEKKKYRRAKKNDVLMPHVADDAQACEKELSSEAQRFQEAVDELCRDLFGEKAKKAVAVATVQPPERTVKNEGEEEEALAQKSVPAADEEENTLSVIEPGDTYADPSEVEDIPLSFDDETGKVLSFKEHLEQNSNDFRLLLDLEYEKELGDAIGFERIRSYHERNINSKKSSRNRNQEKRDEYDKPDQDAEIAIGRRYKKAHSRCMMRLVISFVLFIFTLLYENGNWMASIFGGPLDGAKYPVPYILIGIQILILNVALCYRSLWEGLRQILHFSPVDHSAHAGVLLITLLYHVVLLFVPHTACPVLLLSPAALCLLLLAVTELLNSYREALAFGVISRRQQKYTMLPRISVGSVQESARARLHKGANGGNVWYLRPISFVRNYFSNTACHASRHSNLGAHFLLILGGGAALGIFAFAGNAGAARVLGFAMVVTLLCAPVISAILSSLPLFFSAVFCLKGKAAIIGEIPLERKLSGDTLVLPDNEIFLSMERERFRLLGLCDVHRVTVLLRALLEKIQSPLAASFGVDADSRLSTAEVTLSHIGEEGVSADFAREGCRITLGTAEYMTARGMCFKPVADDNGRLLYVAMDGCVCAVFGVRYTLSADVEPLLNDLRRVGLKVAVRSKDPCVREDVFEQLLEGRVGKIAVRKPAVNELDLRTERVDATVVALHSCKQLARTIVVCCQVGRVGVWGKLLQLICALGGSALAVLLTFFDLLLPGALVTLWIFLWCGFYALLSYFYLRRPTEDI